MIDYFALCLACLARTGDVAARHGGCCSVPISDSECLEIARNVAEDQARCLSLALTVFVLAFLALGLRRPFLWVLAYLYIDILAPQKISWFLLDLAADLADRLHRRVRRLACRSTTSATAASPCARG